MSQSQNKKVPWDHQEFQVPKIEVLNLIRLFWGWVFPYISRIHTAYIGEDSSILGTNEMFGDGSALIFKAQLKKVLQSGGQTF